MTYHEHILTILIEECAEVQQRASKALRFGMYDVQDGQSETNAQRLAYELTDLRASVELIESLWGIRTDDTRAIEAKKAKVQKHLMYARERGTLTDDSDGTE